MVMVATRVTPRPVLNIVPPVRCIVRIAVSSVSPCQPVWSKSLRADLPGFPAQHGALTRQAPMIPSERAGAADHAVARHHESNRILSNGGTDRARSLRRAHF